jgi:hypothetical protein
MRFYLLAAMLLPLPVLAQPNKLATAFAACVVEALREEKFMEPLSGPPDSGISLMCEGASANALFAAMSGVSDQSEQRGLAARSAGPGIQCFRSTGAQCIITVPAGPAFVSAFKAPR